MQFEVFPTARRGNDVRVTWGYAARDLKAGNRVPVVSDTAYTVNGHALICGMTGAGKTFTLKRMVREMSATSDSRNPVRFHVFDVHGDIAIEGASSVMFSEQTDVGINPLKLSADPHFGGVRKRVQGFMATMNSVMRELGPKQQATLRNVLYDVYERHGFRQDDPSTWAVNEHESHLMSDGSGRLYIDVPLAEKDSAKSLGARWDAGARCWYIDAREYDGAITRWPPKTLTRTYPSISDVLRTARYIMKQSFLGSGQEAITCLAAANKASAAYQRKLLEALRKGERGFSDEKMQADIDKAKQKAIEAYTEYVSAISTGREVDDLLRYDSTDVLKGVVDRLENMNAIGVFKPKPPPFDPNASVWRYDIRALGLEERKLFVLFKLQELFAQAVESGEQAQPTTVIVVDEAHIFFDADPENPLNTIAKEARKFGVALICISQSPTHFSEDFIAAVSTKVILGIDELYWRGAATKLRVEEQALAWIKLQKSMLVQIKSRGAPKNDWHWVVIPEMAHG